MVGRGRGRWRKGRDEEGASPARKRRNPSVEEEDRGKKNMKKKKKKKRKKKGKENKKVEEKKKKKKKQRGASRERERERERERTQEEVPVTNCGLIVREIAPAACCALPLLLMLPSVLHVVSSTLRQPPSVLKILIPLKIGQSPRLRSGSVDGIIVSRGWIYVGDFWPVRNCN